MTLKRPEKFSVRLTPKPAGRYENAFLIHTEEPKGRKKNGESIKSTADV